MEITKHQFIYILNLYPRLLDKKNWTTKEENIVEEHFKNLEKLLEDKKLILAGKTEGLDKNTFGIVIIETESEEEARKIMEEDPAVRKEIMKAKLYPYRIALMRRQDG